MASFFDFFDGDETITLDPNQDNFYDPDTTNPIDGNRYRLDNLDAPEAPTYKPNVGYMEGLFEPEHLQQINEAVEKGYDQLDVTGERGHFGRPIANLQDRYGFDYATEYTREGLLGPSRYAIDNADIAFAHSYNKFLNIQGLANQLPAWRQSEMLMQEALSDSVIHQDKSAEGTFFEPLASDYIPGEEEDEDSFSVGKSLEYWWNTNKTAVAGLSALFDPETGKKNVLAAQQAFQDIEGVEDLVVSLEHIDNAGDALAFAANNAIIQGPDYALLLAGTAAAPVTGGASLWLALGTIFLKSTGMYAAESIEEHGEVNAGEAIGMGLAITTIDKFGAKNVLNPAEFFTKEGREKIVQHIAKEEGIPVDNARDIFNKQSANTLRDLSRSLDIGVDDLLNKKEIAQGMLRRIGLQGGQEALTEAAQETLQYLGIHGIPKTSQDWEEYGIRIADAAAAGGVVGSTYRIPQTLSERAQIQNFVHSYENFNVDSANQYSSLQFRTRQAFGDEDLQEAINKYKKPVIGLTLEERQARDPRSYVGRGLAKIKRGDYSYGRGAAYNTFRSIFYNTDGSINKPAAVLANIEGAAQSLPGESLYNAQQRYLGQINVDLPWLVNPEKHLQVSMDELNVILDSISSKNYNNLSDKQIEVANKIGQDLHGINTWLVDLSGFTDQEKSVSDLSWNRLIRRSTPDPQLVRDNSEAFVNLLKGVTLESRMGKKKKGEVVGEEMARKLTEKWISDQDRKGMLDDFASLNLHSNPNFNSFFNDNPLDALQSNIIGEVKYATNLSFRGRDNAVYANAINEMVENGSITEERANELASDIKDQIDKGNNVFGRESKDWLRKSQEYVRTATSLGVMDHSFWSQAGEAAFAFVGVDKNIAEGIGMVARNFAAANSLRYKLDIKKDPDSLTDIQDQYAALGYTDFNETAQQHGAPLETKIGQKVNKYFYWANQTAPISDAVRMTRMQAAGSVIDNLVASIADADLDNPTNFEQQQIERITYYGGNVKRLQGIYKTFETLSIDQIEQLDPNAPELAALYTEWDIMIPKFIDEFAVRTKPGSRPGLFEEKRFGIPLVTQFMSFTSHWSANQLPRFYQVYLQGGGQMAYQAFKVAANALLAAYAAQFIKDWLRYGEESPYLQEWGGIHRAFLYSGLMGWTAEGEQRLIRGPYGFGAGYKWWVEGEPASKALGSEAISAPAISHLGSVGKKLFKGEYGAAIKKGVPLADLHVLSDFYDEDE